MVQIIYIKAILIMNYIKFAIVRPIRYFYNGITTFSSFFSTEQYTNEDKIANSKSQALACDWRAVAEVFNRSIRKIEVSVKGKL